MMIRLRPQVKILCVVFLEWPVQNRGYPQCLLCLLFSARRKITRNRLTALRLRIHPPNRIDRAMPRGMHDRGPNHGPKLCQPTLVRARLPALPKVESEYLVLSVRLLMRKRTLTCKYHDCRLLINTYCDTYHAYIILQYHLRKLLILYYYNILTSYCIQN